MFMLNYLKICEGFYNFNIILIFNIYLNLMLSTYVCDLESIQLTVIVYYTLELSRIKTNYQFHYIVLFSGKP